MTFPVVWEHPSDLIGFCPKQTVFPDSWDSLFQNSYDSWLNSLHITDFSTFG